MRESGRTSKNAEELASLISFENSSVNRPTVLLNYINLEYQFGLEVVLCSYYMNNIQFLNSSWPATELQHLPAQVVLKGLGMCWKLMAQCQPRCSIWLIYKLTTFFKYT